MKQLTFFFFLYAACTTASAQITLLPKAGLNVSTVRFDEDEELPGLKSRVGLTLGLGVNVPQTDVLSFQAEVLYTSKGFSAEENGVADYDGWYSLNYLEVPLLAKATFGSEELSFYGNGGLSVGYLLGGRVKGRWDIVNVVRDDVDQRLEFTDEPRPFVLHEVDANRIDVGLNIGAGINVSAGHLPLFLDVRYNLGLTDYDKDQASKHRTFAITVGSRLAL